MIRTVLDDQYFFEVQAEYAPNLVVGFGRLGGRPVGIVANQPAHLAGCLDINASLKGARFVRFCDCFNIPLVTFEDVPGLPARHRPGVRRHHQARRQAALRLLRGHGAQAHRHHPQGLRRRLLRDGVASTSAADANFAFPTAEIAVMGPEGAVNILYRRELGEAPRPGRASGPSGSREYREKFANPYVAAERGLHRRGHRAAGDAPPARPGARDAPDQARPEPAPEAREPPAVTARPPTSGPRGPPRPAAEPRAGPARGRAGALGARDAQARARAHARAPRLRDVLGRARAPPGDAGRPRGLRLRPRARVPGRVSVHPRRPADDVPRAASGPCASTPGSARRPRPTSASATSSRQGQTGPVGGLRPADPDGLRRGRPRWRAARSAGSGVSISSVDDMAELLQDLPLDRVSTSMTINATAAILLALYMAVAERQGVSPRRRSPAPCRTTS